MVCARACAEAWTRAARVSKHATIIRIDPPISLRNTPRNGIRKIPEAKRSPRIRTCIYSASGGALPPPERGRIGVGVSHESRLERFPTGDTEMISDRPGVDGV